MALAGIKQLLKVGGLLSTVYAPEEGRRSNTALTATNSSPPTAGAMELRSSFTGI